VEATLDRSVPFSAQQEMQRLVPGGRRVTLETDHAPQLSAPAALIAALVEFAVALDAWSGQRPNR
jgi:pimeloyl-ACP methyl ester carboxylesterase